MQSLVRLLDGHGVPDAAAKAIVVACLFLAASVLARLARGVTIRLQARAGDDEHDSPLAALARRETAVSLVTTSVQLVVLLVAVTLSLVVLTGAKGVGALAGASFVAVVVGFAAQRFLTDVLAGIVMFTEGWYTVGSTIVVEPWKLEGVVEEVSVRATTIRDVTGALLRVHNSQVLAVRVLPGGAHRYELELYVHDAAAGEALVEEVAQIVPIGPTAFVRPPRLGRARELDDDLHRLTADVAVAAGRRFMAEDLLPSLMRERAPEGLIVHGPVVLPTDERAATRFARAERLLAGRRG